MWYLWYDTFSHHFLCPKEKEKKRNINNDSAIFPSHNIWEQIVKCIYSVAQSIKDSIEFSSNTKKPPGLNPRLGS